MQKLFFTSLFAVIISGFTSSCNTASPEKYFDVAVLNCNMMMGFANEGLLRELEYPSVKMADGDKDKTAPMKREEIIKSKISYLEPNFEKLKALKETGDTKDILQASIALNAYVLPVYKNEYMQPAKLYDEGAPKEQVASFAGGIQDKYFGGFNTRYDKLIAAGKLFAGRHNIKVNWGN